MAMLLSLSSYEDKKAQSRLVSWGCLGAVSWGFAQRLANTLRADGHVPGVAGARGLPSGPQQHWAAFST